MRKLFRVSTYNISAQMILSNNELSFNKMRKAEIIFQKCGIVKRENGILMRNADFFKQSRNAEFETIVKCGTRNSKKKP